MVASDLDAVNVKRERLSAWIEAHSTCARVVVARRGEPVNARQVLADLGRAVKLDSMCVYLLVEAGPEVVTRYIGKTNDPAARWKAHLAALAAGLNGYGLWRQALLDERGLARADLDLIVIEQGEILEPPLAGFPTTIGSIEYPLVGLAQDAHPGQLLNHEGNRR